jgi:hypothetical protein
LDSATVPARVGARAGKQGQPGALLSVRPVAVAGREPLHGSGLPGLQPVVDAVRYADRRVEVADLGLVVPEHRQPAVAADAVPAHLQHLTQAAAGGDQRLPDVAHAVVERVVVVEQPAQIGLVGQRPRDLVRERPASAHRQPFTGGQRGRELPVQAEPVKDPGVQGVPQHRTQAVEDDAAGRGGHHRRPTVGLGDAQRRQPVAFAAALVGDEPVHLLRVQHRRVVAAARGVDREERAQLDAGPPQVVKTAGGARAARRLQQPGQVVPGQVPKPALPDPGQVEAAGAAREPHPEVLGVQRPALAGLVRRAVDPPQLAGDLGADAAYRAVRSVRRWQTRSAWSARPCGRR